MRVLAITNLFPNPMQPERGAANRQHFRALARNHEVKVVAPISWIDELRGYRRGVVSLPGDRRWQLDGIDIVHPRFYYPPRIMRSHYGRMFLRAIRAEVLEIARDFRPDILLGSWAYPDGYAAVELARELNLPAAVHVLGSDINLLDQYPARRGETIKTLRAADVVIAVSQDLAHKVIDLGVNASRVAVVHRGVDRELFFPGSQAIAQADLGIPAADPMLLMIGNLVPVKAVDVLVSACGLLADRFPRLQCHIIGNGPLLKKLRTQADELSVADKVQFHGVIEHHTLPTWYRAADLVVLPSLAEGVPNVLLESIASGRRYVASNTGGIPEISAHAGCSLVEPGQPQTLAAAICSRLEDQTPPTPSDLPAASWDEASQSLGAALARVTRTRPQIIGGPIQAIA